MTVIIKNLLGWIGSLILLMRDVPLLSALTIATGVSENGAIKGAGDAAGDKRLLILRPGVFIHRSMRERGKT